MSYYLLAPGTLLMTLLLAGLVMLTWQEPGGPGPRLDWHHGVQRGDLVAEDVILSQFLADGRLDFRARAAQAYHDPERRAVFMRGLDVLKPQQAGLVTLSAGAGSVADDSRLVSLYGGVHVNMAPDYRVSTAALRYDPATGLVVGDAPVSVQWGRDWMHGKGLRLSIPERTVVLQSQVKAYYGWVSEVRSQ